MTDVAFANWYTSRIAPAMSEFRVRAGEIANRAKGRLTVLGARLDADLRWLLWASESHGARMRMAPATRLGDFVDPGGKVIGQVMQCSNHHVAFVAYCPCCFLEETSS